MDSRIPIGASKTSILGRDFILLPNVEPLPPQVGQTYSKQTDAFLDHAHLKCNTIPPGIKKTSRLIRNTRANKMGMKRTSEGCGEGSKWRVCLCRRCERSKKDVVYRSPHPMQLQMYRTRLEGEIRRWRRGFTLTQLETRCRRGRVWHTRHGCRTLIQRPG